MRRFRVPLVSASLLATVAACAPEPRAVDVPVIPEANRAESSESAPTPASQATAPVATTGAAAQDAGAGWDDDAQALYGKDDTQAVGRLGSGGIVLGSSGLTGPGTIGVGGGHGVPPGVLPGSDGGGPLGPDPIRRVVMSHRGALQACYQIEVQKNPALAGKVVLTWTIDSTGLVSQAAVASTTMHNDRVEKCIVRQVLSWRFPASGGTAAVTYPFMFGVAGDGGA